MIEFTGAYPLIHNKVTSPRFTTPTLRRPRLLDWLNANANARAVVLAADAGYGKTTLLWQWEREVDFPCYWYKLDQNDRDWSLHISYLIESIAQRHPGFGKRAHSMLMQLGGPGSSRPGVAAYLLSEIYERLTEPCTFIIDDWQYVNNVTEVRGLWNQILRDAPPTCRFIFASRSKPRLQFARFKTHAGYAQLGTDALRLTDVEIDSLFRDIYLDPLDPAELAELERRTEGWAASLQLVEVSLRERLTPEARREFIQSITATTDSDLFTFLAEEVLDQQTEQTRNFLLCTSILQQITPDLAERLAGVHDGARELAELEQRGLFTFRLDDARYRYHNLFRDFLEHKLTMERSETEVIALHIHAASYFETTEQWPQAIHHYLRAGLQPQAARLIAKYGEDVVAEGRLGLVDEWLQQLPARTINANARLSLLQGEALGIRGDWAEALAALKRARDYFACKGDRRMQALALLKLSSIANNQGNVQTCAQLAREGLELAPENAYATRLRLRGNVAIASTWLGSLEDAGRECARIAAESSTRGLDHFAAIAYHNLGSVQRFIGMLEPSVANLERAAKFWAGIPNSPFADNGELVLALLARGDVARAERLAAEGVRSTSPWVRPHADALLGRAAVLEQQGRFAEAIEALHQSLVHRLSLGSTAETNLSLLIELLYLSNGNRGEIISAADDLRTSSLDPRLAPVVSVAQAVAAHGAGICTEECNEAAEVLEDWGRKGATFISTFGKLKLAVLAFEHHDRLAPRRAMKAIADAATGGVLPLSRWWLRRLSPYVTALARQRGAIPILLRLLEKDPDHWRGPITTLVDKLTGDSRELVLRTVVKHANRGTVEALMAVRGQDAADARRSLLQRQAARLFIRSFGALTVHRGAWDGPRLDVSRRRPKLLLGLLVAHAHTTLTREMALDILWPNSEPAAAVNNLNQTVFQLRRHLDPDYREGYSANYVTSTPDAVLLDLDLVRTDLDEFRKHARRVVGSDPATTRRTSAGWLIELVRGEFLADLRYEEWVAGLQLTVGAEIRQALLPLASDELLLMPPELALRAGCVLTALDEFDEGATLAVVKQLQVMGKRTAAREVIARFARRLNEELEENPSPALVAGLRSLGIADPSIADPTSIS